jgi:hypothetical protein
MAAEGGREADIEALRGLVPRLRADADWLDGGGEYQTVELEREAALAIEQPIEQLTRKT